MLHAFSFINVLISTKIYPYEILQLFFIDATVGIFELSM
jgi:hypothetical protein